jgi:hypothetical protein
MILMPRTEAGTIADVFSRRQTLFTIWHLGPLRAFSACFLGSNLRIWEIALKT